MEQNVFECLACHTKFLATENHTCRSEVIAHLSSKPCTLHKLPERTDGTNSYVQNISGSLTMDHNNPLTAHKSHNDTAAFSDFTVEAQEPADTLYTSYDLGYQINKSPHNGYQISEQLHTLFTENCANFSPENTLNESTSFNLPSLPSFNLTFKPHMIPLQQIYSLDSLSSGYVSPFPSDAKQKEIANYIQQSQIGICEPDSGNLVIPSCDEKLSELDMENELPSHNSFSTISNEEYLATNHFRTLTKPINNICAQDFEEGTDDKKFSLRNIPAAKGHSGNLSYTLVQKIKKNDEEPQKRASSVTASQMSDNRSCEILKNGEVLVSVGHEEPSADSSILDVSTKYRAVDGRFKCPECGKILRHKRSLVTHKRIHAGEKPYACDHCEKKIRDKCDLRRHIRIHTGEKQNACDQCNKKFIQKSDLKNHIRIHTGEKPFKCSLCRKAFTYNSSRTSHYKKVHHKI